MNFFFATRKEISCTMKKNFSSRENFFSSREKILAV